MLSTRLLLLAAVIAALALMSSMDHPQPAEGAFPGLNGKIIFQSSHNAPGQDFYTVDPDGTDLTQMIDPLPNEADAKWSPDGTKIAFSRGQIDIYVMNLDGSGVTNITNSPTVYEFGPAWSPDGARIAFVQDHGSSHYEIHLINVDGTGPQQLTSNAGYNIQPAWSPDGSKIAFASDMGGTQQFEVYTMNPDGTGQTNVTNNPFYDDGPDWSPDGTQIAFRSDRTGSGDIYIMDADGSNPSQLTTYGATDFGAVWSPDGSRIAFTRVLLPQVNYEIYVMDAGGANELRLTNHPEVDTGIDWQAADDTDLDGCFDQIEIGTDPARGGQRDSQSFWDFDDQYAGVPLARDRVIAVGDIGAVVKRFGTSGNPTDSPLIPPLATNGYHTSADRSGVLPGEDPWDLQPPNGQISVEDIGAVVAQFGHRCT